MRRTIIVSAVIITALSIYVFAGEITSERRKAETLAKADNILGHRYNPPAGKPNRFYDEQTETGPPDAVIYSYTANYVVELIFAPDGSVARVEIHPEALLYSGNWSSVPAGAELSRAALQSVVESANALQPLGQGRIKEAPNGCFQSGQNLYCSDTYERAVVGHFHQEKSNKKEMANIVLREISISYRQSVSGVVEDVRIEGSQRQLKVAGYWYHGEKPGIAIFSDSAIGAVVQLATFGCAANEKVCIAIPEESKSGTTK